MSWRPLALLLATGFISSTAVTGINSIPSVSSSAWHSPNINKFSVTQRNRLLMGKARAHYRNTESSDDGLGIRCQVRCEGSSTRDGSGMKDRGRMSDRSMIDFENVEYMDRGSPGFAIYPRRHVAPALLSLFVSAFSSYESEAHDVKVIADSKSRHLPIERIRDIVEQDFTERKCLVSGDISPEIYADDCVFTDPQMSTRGLEKFVRGTKALFVAERSELELLGPVVITANSQIVAKFREVACFNIPFRPKTYFTGNLTLTIGKDNLIEDYLEQWDLSIREILATAKPSF